MRVQVDRVRPELAVKVPYRSGSPIQTPKSPIPVPERCDIDLEDATGCRLSRVCAFNSACLPGALMAGRRKRDPLRSSNGVIPLRWCKLPNGTLSCQTQRPNP